MSQHGLDASDTEPGGGSAADSLDALDGIAQTSSSNELSHKLFFEKLPNGLTFCKICGRAVSHMKNHFTTHSNEKAQCPVCFVFRSRPDNLKRHIKAVHPDYPL